MDQTERVFYFQLYNFHILFQGDKTNMERKNSMMKLARTFLFIMMPLGILSCQIIPFGAGLTATPLPLPTEITDAKSVTMRLVPAGPFTMGSDDEKAGDAKPAHMVTLADFYMDVYEVTRIRYKECVASGVCSEASVPSINMFYASPDYPMSSIDWNQSKTYCEWRGARLPIEAEWEKAARGTDGRTYPWGEGFDSSYVKLEPDAKGDYLSKVGSYEKGKSPYGMYDMAGSVWEWVSDPLTVYPGNQGDHSYYRETDRVLRGGSWYFPDRGALSSWFRYASPPEVIEGSFGFRCAVSADSAVSMPISISPTPFETSSPNPKMKKDQHPNLLMPGSTDQTLRSLAKEKYSDEDYASRTDFAYSIFLGQPKEVVWHWYWCAKDETILTQNLEHIRVTFNLNYQEIPLDELVQDHYVDGTSVCHVYYVTLFDWPVGSHHLANIVHIDQPINDGWSDYSAGNRSYKYFVSVKP